MRSVLISQVTTTTWSAWKINLGHKRTVNSHQLGELQKTQTFIATARRADQGGGGGRPPLGKKMTPEACQTHPTTLCQPQLSGSGVSKQQQMGGEGRRLNRKLSSGTSRNKGRAAERPHLRGEEGRLRLQPYRHPWKNLYSPSIGFDARKRKG